MTDETDAGLIDDPSSYEIPEEPTPEWLARALIADFAVYQTALQANPSLTTPNAHKNRVLRAYVRGSMKPKSAISVLRWVYSQQLSQSDRIVPD